MNIQELPTVRVEIDNAELKKQQIERLCKAYKSIVGSRITKETLSEIFNNIRLFNNYRASPLLFFSYSITASPKEEYAPYFLLDATTNVLYTMPVSLANAVEQTIYLMAGSIPRAVNIEFDPFDIEWETIEEYNALMNVFIENGLDDVRYKWYLTIQFW